MVAKMVLRQMLLVVVVFVVCGCMSDASDVEEGVRNVFDDSCWSIRSQLDDFQLDTCSDPISKQSVVIGTYNALFLFDGISDPRLQRQWTSAAAAEDHLEDIADVVRRHQPDILNINEVENIEVLRDLVSEIGNPVYTPYLVNGRDFATGQDVSLITQDITVQSLTRTNCRSDPIPGSQCRSSFSDSSGVSKNLVALFDSCLFGRKFAIVAVHFYAFPNSASRCVRRESQARVIQDVIQQLMAADFEVMVMGDMNDYSDVYEDTHPDSPRSRVLSMLRDPNGDGVDELDNVMSFIPRAERYSAWWDQDSDDEFAGSSEGTQIDHILMTHGLYSRVRRAWIDHRPNPEIVSDHWPLFVEMTTGRTETT